MKTLGYDKSTFRKWLEEERVYLQSLPTEPLQETYEMDYYMHLVELNKHEQVFFLASDNLIDSRLGKHYPTINPNGSIALQIV